MYRLNRLFVWLSRIRHCRGFGIQSPTDYWFVRYVVNEHWPYYAYEELGLDDGWLHRKLGHLYFRLVNWRQPQTIIDRVGVGDYLHAGCRRASVVNDASDYDLAIVSLKENYHELFDHAVDGSVIVFQDIAAHKDLWRSIMADKRATICFDLYYCGIVVFDSHRTKQSYVVNF